MESEKITVSKPKLSCLALLSLFLSLFGLLFVLILSLPRTMDMHIKILHILFPFGSSIPFYTSFFAPYFSHVIALVALIRISKNPLLRGKHIAIVALVLSYLWMLWIGVIYMFGKQLSTLF